VRLRGDRGHTRKTARRRETHRSARKPFAAALSSVCSISARPRAVEALFEAFGRGDVPYILDQLTDDVHWVAHLDPSVPWSGDYSGKANVPWVYVWKLRDGKITGYDQFNDAGLAAAFA
jgi:ketosteroid isomerase-like protein